MPPQRQLSQFGEPSSRIVCVAVSKSYPERYIIMPYMSDPELSWGGFRYTIVDKGVIDSLNKISIAFKYRKSTIIDCDYCTFA